MVDFCIRKIIHSSRKAVPFYPLRSVHSASHLTVVGNCALIGIVNHRFSACAYHVHVHACIRAMWYGTRAQS